MHISSTLNRLLTVLPGAGILLIGDFNSFKDSYIKSSFNLKQIVTKPSRKSAILDCIYTNFSDYYETPSIQPAIRLSDHRVIICKPYTSIKHQQSTVSYHWARRMGQNERTFYADAITKHDWTPLYNIQSCEEKLSNFYEVIDLCLNKHCPWKQVKHCQNDKPWVYIQGARAAEEAIISCVW